MKSPYELMNWYVVPAIRKNVVLGLMNFGIKQSRISKILDITPSAVSQYLSNKRGDGIVFNEEFKSDIDVAVERIVENNDICFFEINKLALKFQNKKFICELCMKVNNIVDCEDYCK